jgi:hypothetical protein
MIQNISNILVDYSKNYCPYMICIVLQHIVFKDKVIQYFVLLELKDLKRKDPRK